MILAALLALSTPAGPAPCTPGNAVPASVREMARAPDRWLGRCVRVEGYARVNIFYADVAGFYAAEASNRDDRPNDGWLGLYGPPFVARGRLRQGTVVGVLHDCARDHEAAAARAGPGTIVMSLGYCHYRPGLILLRARFRARGAAQFERQVGDAARIRFGDLIPASADHPAPPEVVALAARFLGALRSGDGTALRAMTEPWSEILDADTETGFQSFLEGRAGSPLGDLRAGPGDPQMAYFRERQDRNDVEFGYAQRWHICFCRGPDCRGRWPIGTLDSTVVQRRPYACLRAIKSGSLLGPPDQLTVERRDSLLIEPSDR